MAVFIDNVDSISLCWLIHSAMCTGQWLQGDAVIKGGAGGIQCVTSHCPNECDVPDKTGDETPSFVTFSLCS